MTEEKKKKTRRPKHEVAADYERRAARIKWSGVRDASDLLGKARKLIEEAQAAAGDHATSIDFKGAVKGLSEMEMRLDDLIPPEAR